MNTTLTYRLTFLLFIALFGTVAQAQYESVLHALQFEAVDKLAQDAASHGDAIRGANVFFQPHLACANCHATNDIGPMSLANVGPKLTRENSLLTDAAIIEAVLHPSRSIAKGFETIQVLTTGGQVLTGILIEESNQVVQLREPSTGKTITLNRDEVEELTYSKQSIMPEGVAGQLTSRQQFLDLVRYLMAIRDGGVARAKELQPAVMPTSEPLPAYESRLDHAGMIAEFDKKSFKRGKIIYDRLCVNCHGTVTEAGSLPTSLRFASCKFKNGFDPFSMYQTITRGFGLMMPQRQLVPSQKYDVIHYIREAYLQPHNRSQYAKIDEAYLAGLPKGNARGPKASTIEPWQQMDYGPNLMATYEIGNDASNFAYKGHAIRLDHGTGGIAQGQHRIVYEHDTMRVAAAWSGKEFIDWNGINFNGAHQIHPRIKGDILLANKNGPGWANPENDSFDEPREPGRDGRFYGPLPKDWIDFRGCYVNGPVTTLRYAVGETEILEQPGIEHVDSHDLFLRHLAIDASTRRLIVRVADRPDSKSEVIKSAKGSFVFSKSTNSSANVLLGVIGDFSGTEWMLLEDEIRLSIAAHNIAKKITLCATRVADRVEAQHLVETLESSAESVRNELPVHLSDMFDKNIDGHARRWPETVTLQITTTETDGPFTIERLEYPANTPWFCRMRLTGVDFFPDGNSAAVCDWDGNVWRVTGLHQESITWQRMASGLFQPLGIKIRDGAVFVTCRDQICRLHDLNNDGETDYYECFNHDHFVTDHFHEFAMGLQCDAEGNFYYAKSACHALPAKVPHHGTLLKVSADGQRTEILANGFRAANGVCLNPDGSFFVTDQEGHWNPKNRINWVRRGRFYGNMLGYHDVTDTSDAAMESPMCWITNAFDRSPAELLWVASEKWGPLNGSLLNMSYGYGKLYVVPHERKGDLMQGGMCELPLPQFPTGIMRGRFHPSDGGLYLVGMFAWAGNQEDNGGFYRVRYNGKPLYVPLSLRCQGTTVRIGLSDAIDPSSIKTDQFEISRWNIKRTKNYGSPHFDTVQLRVQSATWNEASRELVLELPELQPTWCMEMKLNLKSLDGKPIHRVIHHTIHDLTNRVDAESD